MKRTKNIIIKLATLILAVVLMLGSFAVQASAVSKKKTLIVYFSRTGTTKEIARKIQKLTGADIVEIKTKKSYPSGYNDLLKAAQEEQDRNARPELATRITNFKDYKSIIIGYPIWLGIQPMAINTFLESYDFTGKKVIPFCTSGGSGISDSIKSIRKICKSADFGTGLNATNAGNKKLKKWLIENKVTLISSSPKVTLKINKKNVTKKIYSVKKGKKVTLKASVSNLKGKKKIKYSSSNKKVVTVNAKGIIKAKKSGTAKIKVTVNSKKKKVTAWTKIKVMKKTSSKPKKINKNISKNNTLIANTQNNTTSNNNTLNDNPLYSGSQNNNNQNNNTSNKTPNNNNNSTDSNVPDNDAHDDNISDNNTPNSNGKQTNILIAYFSATGTTKTLAGYAAEYLNADLYEIVPKQPYTDEDLAYYTNGRADKEQNDPSARPAISGSVKNIEQYDTILLGYPIWHGQAPRIISTFLESYDFSGKTILPFCTSHSSDIGSSDTDLHSLAANANWIKGKRFAAETAKEEIIQWVKEKGIEPFVSKNGEIQMERVFNFETKTVKLNSGYEMPLNGIGTYSLLGDTCINSVSEALKRGVRLIDTAYMYNNEEEVGEAIRNSDIPRSEIFVTTKLYPNQFSDPEKAIDEALEKLNVGYIDLLLLHHPGDGDVEAYKAMEKAVEEGKIRSIGLSNWYIEELEEFLPQVTITPAVVQNEIHPYYQESEIIKYIHNLGIVVEGWYPFGGRGHTAELLGDEVISKIAKAHSVSSAQVILRWNLQKGVVVIPGSSNPDHIQENTKLYDFELTDEEMEQINALNRNEKHDWY